MQWEGDQVEIFPNCFFKFVIPDTSFPRRICHLSTADLPRFREDAAASKCFMANKFNLDVDPVAVLCQAKEIVKKTMDMLT